MYHYFQQIASYLLDLPEKDEEEVERAQINNFDTLWGETGMLRPLVIRFLKRSSDTVRSLVEIVFNPGNYFVLACPFLQRCFLR